MVMYSLWGAITLLIAHGVESGVQPAGILVIETLGSFFLARRFVQNDRDFTFFAKLWFFSVVSLIPFALYESLTDTPIILEVVRRFAPTFPKTLMDSRHGLHRAQVVFEHPILFGSFCAGAFGLAYYVLNPNWFSRIIRSTFVILSVGLSVSGGALLSLIVQMFLVVWELITRNINGRWLILVGLILSAYVAVDMISNRTPFHVFVTYATFSTESAYGRILIFDYGIASVAKHPLFGIGQGDWERAAWMTGSMDNFWLVLAVQNGLPGFAFFTLAAILIVRRTAKVKLNLSLARHRIGLLTSIGGMAIGGATVDYWNATYCLFVFLLGSGMWILDDEAQPETVDSAASTEVPISRDLISVRYRATSSQRES
jgi:hypothetical protein